MPLGFSCLWYLPLAKISKRSMKHFFLLATNSSNCQGNIFLHQMQLVNPSYNWENGINQIKITKENLCQSCIWCQLLRKYLIAKKHKQTQCNAWAKTLRKLKYFPLLKWMHAVPYWLAGNFWIARPRIYQITVLRP